MNLKSYLKVISEKKLFIVAIALFCGILAFILAFFNPKSYDAFILMTVHRAEREKTSDFQYDNYYAIQAAEYIGNTVTGWLETPEVVTAIYKKAELENDLGNVFQEVKKIKPKQLSSHLIRVKLNNKEQDKADKLAKALIQVTKEKMSKLEVDFSGKSSFSIEAEEPVIVLKKYDPYLVAVFGLLGGIFMGIGLAFLREYLKTE